MADRIPKQDALQGRENQEQQEQPSKQNRGRVGKKSKHREVKRSHRHAPIKRRNKPKPPRMGAIGMNMDDIFKDKPMSLAYDHNKERTSVTERKKRHNKSKRRKATSKPRHKSPDTSGFKLVRTPVRIYNHDPNYRANTNPAHDDSTHVQDGFDPAIIFEDVVDAQSDIDGGSATEATEQNQSDGTTKDNDKEVKLPDGAPDYLLTTANNTEHFIATAHTRISHHIITLSHRLQTIDPDTAEYRTLSRDNRALESCIPKLESYYEALNIDNWKIQSGNTIVALAELSRKLKASEDDAIKSIRKEVEEISMTRGHVKTSEKSAQDVSDRYFDPFRATKSRIFTDDGVEKQAGGLDSIESTMWETNMPAHEGAKHLYDILHSGSWNKENSFIQIMRVLARKDARDLEASYQVFSRGRETLRQALAKRYGLPSYKPRGYSNRAKNLVMPLDNMITNYLFEQLDNGGKATVATRAALSLGMMANKVSSHIVVDELEVVRVVELMEHEELQHFWHTHRFVLRGNLNTYNYKRIKRFVEANSMDSYIKATAKTVSKTKGGMEDQKYDAFKAGATKEEGEEGYDDYKTYKTYTENQKKLGDWQEKILKSENGLIPYFHARDAHLAAIVKGFSRASNKWTGRVSPSLGNLKGYVKDLGKEVESWLKTVAKEEGRLFSGTPVIRRYISGQVTEFTCENGVKVTIRPPKPTRFLKETAEGDAFLKSTHGIIPALLFQYPFAFVGSFFGIGRYFLTEEQKQFWRSSKYGWNKGDRTFLRMMVETGTHVEDKANEESPSQGGNEASSTEARGDSQQQKPDATDVRIEGGFMKDGTFDGMKVVNNIRQVLRQRGKDFAPEMVPALANLARQAEITFDTQHKWYKLHHSLTKNRFRVNRRQDLHKSIMKLPDRWRVQFLNAFLSPNTPIEKSPNKAEADKRVAQATGMLKQLLIALQMEPKQIYEAIGSLKYGRDITDTYIQLREHAGKRTFSGSRALFLAQQLNDKELEIARTDIEMHRGLERQFAKYMYRLKGFGPKRGRYADQFKQLANLLHINPKLNWNRSDRFNSSTYRALAKDTSYHESKRGPQALFYDKPKKRYNATSYHAYYLEHITGPDKATKTQEKEVEKLKRARRDEQASLDDLTNQEDLEVEAQTYQTHVRIWASRFAQSIENTKDYNKVLQVALEVWQRGDEFVMPQRYFTQVKNTNPHLKVDKQHLGSIAQAPGNRKNIFLYEVYSYLNRHHNASYRKFNRLTNFGLRSRNSSRSVNVHQSLEDPNFDLVNEILKSNYRWYRNASDRDQGYASGSFQNLSGRVLLEEWTNVSANTQKIQQRNNLRDEILQIKANRSNIQKDNKGVITGFDEKEQLEAKEKELEKLNKELRTDALPMPRADRLKQIRNAFPNDASYSAVIKNLFMHLSSSVEFDKSFADALLEKGYMASDVMNLTEIYKYLAVQERDKFLTGGKWTIQWKVFSTISAERKEGNALLLGAMRNLHTVRDEGKVHSDLGDDKGDFYDAFFDEVDERQDMFVSKGKKYRKNITTAIFTLGSLAAVPFGGAIASAAGLLGELIIPLLFTGLGAGTTMLSTAMDQEKHHWTSFIGESLWGVVKGALLSAVFYGTIQLESYLEAISGMEGLSDKINDGKGPVAQYKAQRFGLSIPIETLSRTLKELGKEGIRGLDKCGREGPKAGLVYYSTTMINRAMLIDILTKTGVGLAFEHSGLNDKLDYVLQGAKDSSQEHTSNRAKMVRKFFRKAVYKEIGIKSAIGALEYIVSNQHGAHKAFIEKYDVTRLSPTPFTHVENLKSFELAQDMLAEIQNEFRYLQENTDEQVNINTSVLENAMGMVKQNDYIGAKALLEYFTEVYAQVKGSVTAATDISQGRDFMSQMEDGDVEDILKEAQESIKAHKNGGKSAPTSSTSSISGLGIGGVGKSTTKRNRRPHKISNINPFGATKKGPKKVTPREQNIVSGDMEVIDNTGDQNNCLIFSIAKGIDRDLSDAQAQNIRQRIGIRHTGFLENSPTILNRICTELGYSIEIHFWEVDNYNTIKSAGASYTYGSGEAAGSGSARDRVVHILNVGQYHFMYLRQPRQQRD
ncbi:hypothetical protein BKI52_20025 [marine bacterium AO1-C]|nr:hypothetical protein BKI52_20025 [marine bacterium AO1-C]